MGLFDMFKKKENTVTTENNTDTIITDKKENIIKTEEDEMIEKISSDMKDKTIIDNYKIGFKKEKCDIFDSKIGGMPYWDTNLEYPKTSEGKNLVLLVQINFEKEQFDDDRLPKKGILQFFVKNNWLWMNNEEYKVIYHENINNNFNFDDIKELNIKTTLDQEINIDISGENKLIFKKNQEAISVDDFQFLQFAWNSYSKKYSANELDFEEKYNNMFGDELRDKFDLGNGSKLLGYPGFCQYDPRSDIQNGKDLFLLLQLDAYNNITPYDKDVRLKDGILNFFITIEDLENRNFDNVIMHGDFH